MVDPAERCWLPSASVGGCIPGVLRVWPQASSSIVRGLVRNASSRHPAPPPLDLMNQELCQSALTKLPRRFWGALKCEDLRLSSVEPHGELAERSPRVLGVVKCN